MNGVNNGSYNLYSGFDSFSYACIKYLVDKDDVVWKLLKYVTPDAWSKPNLSYEEKISLIYNGTDDTTKFNVFMDTGQPDVQTTEKVEIRIHPYAVMPNNRVWGSLKIQFEVYSHYKINHLTNYKTRIDMITERFLGVFNGADISSYVGSGLGSIGNLHFDALGTYGTVLESGGQLPFKGKYVLMGIKTA